jgi:hypothetical protein
MLRNIDRRIHNEYAVEASLHGIKVPLRFNSTTQAHVEMSDDERAHLERVMKQGQQRVRARYG